MGTLLIIILLCMFEPFILLVPLVCIFYGVFLVGCIIWYSPLLILACIVSLYRFLENNIKVLNDKEFDKKKIIKFN
jgi:uncharacterized membrane protein